MTRSPESMLHQRRARLLERIHRRYRTLTEQLRLSTSAGVVSFEFTRVEDPNRVLDQVAAEEDRRERVSGNRRPGEELHLPYWAELWDSAVGMAQFLIKRLPPAAGCPPPVGPLSLLDLGCGMGLTGSIAASLGHRVLFADMEPPALLFARLNAARWADQVRTRRLNWQTARLDETFDRIVGADILYERTQWDFLEPFWRTHLAAGGSVLLGEPGRQTGDKFPAWITERGWILTSEDQPVETRSKPIRIFEVRRG